MERKHLIRLCLIGALLLLSGLWFYPSTSRASTPSPLNPLQSSTLHTPEECAAAPAIEEQEVTLDGVRRFTRHDRSKQPSTTVLVLTKDADSWGHNVDQPPRTFKDFLSLLNSTGLDLADTSLGLLTSTEDQYSLFKTATQDTGLASTSIFLHPGYADEDVSRGDRHDESTQVSRRAQIAKLRNYLMLRSLGDESHIIWLDSDVFELHTPRVFQKMISQSKNSREAGIITARCEIGPIMDYDGNAWKGALARASIQHAENSMCTDGDAAEKTVRVGDLIKGTSDDELVKLDSVGATVLYMRASLVHRGLTFPSSFVVGTTWEMAGWDGIETEGLCYQARALKGGGCYALGGAWMVRHTDR